MWHCLQTLLELVSFSAAHYLLDVMGIDSVRLETTWSSLRSIEQAWSEAHNLQDEWQQQLWQDESRDPVVYYRNCYEFIETHRSSIREHVLNWQQHWLCKQLQIKQSLTDKREQEIFENREQLQAIRPDDMTLIYYRHSQIPPQENPHTIAEIEGHLVWLINHSED
jgi:hypothetical protein